ncbi:MAG: DUF1616 domain-containing protein [Archaeoglobaceae archaeon]
MWSITIVMVVIETLRAVFGLAVVMIIPGYAWSRVLYRGNEIDILERAGLSIGLSIALITLLVLGLNKIGMDITATTTLGVAAGLTIVPLIGEQIYFGFMKKE